MVTSRIWFTAAQKAELWERWKNGQSAAAIRLRRNICRRGPITSFRAAEILGKIGVGTVVAPPISS
jgi:hypothetical protein